jgi:hypothetical protein
LKGTRFDDLEKIEHNATEQLLAVPKTEFERGFQHWQEWCNKCGHAEGAYFEAVLFNQTSHTHYAGITM